MNMIINRTVDDGTLRAAAILQTQGDLHRALTLRSPQLDELACLTLVQTSAGVRTLSAVVNGLLPHADAPTRLAALIEQSRRCGLPAVCDGLDLVWRSRQQARVAESVV
ncbi:hypothetical protein [Aquabacterium sp.]|uniref:hypothetical protein n=1 Tax=Aquabacterium sp. TaxID=1872578 RepID=UPI002CC150E0|nr:hypothetical protein [Aquabacterium sp.]HSW08314.1 hypothetical protein [Aquabacterium sp.]